jgi:hypothetical protein
VRNAFYTRFDAFTSHLEANKMIFCAVGKTSDFACMALIYMLRANNSFLLATRWSDKMKSNLSSLVVSSIVWHDDLAILGPAVHCLEQCFV